MNRAVEIVEFFSAVVGILVGMLELRARGVFPFRRNGSFVDRSRGQPIRIIVAASARLPIYVRVRDFLVLPKRSAFERQPRTDLPGWVVIVLGSEDAERYRKEWGAHLWEMIEAGELKQARRDRRRLIRAVLWLAFAIRVHRALKRVRAR